MSGVDFKFFIKNLKKPPPDSIDEKMFWEKKNSYAIFEIFLLHDNSSVVIFREFCPAVLNIDCLSIVTCSIYYMNMLENILNSHALLLKAPLHKRLIFSLTLSAPIS